MRYYIVIHLLFPNQKVDKEPYSDNINIFCENDESAIARSRQMWKEFHPWKQKSVAVLRRNNGKYEDVFRFRS